MYQTHTLSEVAAAVSLGTSSVSLIALGLAFAPADLAYFDPRPWLDRAGARLCVEIVRARFTAGAACDRVRLAVVSGLLLIVTHLDPTSSVPKKGASRA